MGAEIVKLFAAEGAMVACCDIADCGQIVRHIQTANGNAKSFTFDARNKDDILRLARYQSKLHRNNVAHDFECSILCMCLFFALFLQWRVRKARQIYTRVYGSLPSLDMS